MEPNIEEKNLYFSGLPSRSRLVARSNFDVNFKPGNGGIFYPVTKFLSPTSPNHPIAALWDGPLRKDIINALYGIDWISIDIVRLGLHENPDRGLPEPEQPHVLLVSVANTTWGQGFPAVMSCRRIMEQYGLDDIHCEMKEMVLADLSCEMEEPVAERSASAPNEAPNKAPPLAPKLTSQSEVFPESEYCPGTRHRTMASELLGASIALFDSPTWEATKGLYLRRKDTGATLALTCRHMLSKKGSELSNELYQHNPDTTPRLVIQPGSGTLNDMLKFAERMCCCTETRRANVEARADYTEDRRHTRLTELQNELDSYRQWRDYVQSIAAPESRIIGHVLFSPKVSPGKSPSGESRLRDWALIELHPNKHQTALVDLKNSVTLTEEKGLKMRWLANDATPGHQCFLGIDEPLQLERSTVSEAEIKMLATMDGHNKEPRLVVAMYGKTGELQIGFSNCVPSILREVIDGKAEYSEVWGIIGEKDNSSAGSKHFCLAGDSGSCIWDIEGRVAGIMVGGPDVGYAHPIEWLLEDIRTQSGIDLELI